MSLFAPGRVESISHILKAIRKLLQKPSLRRNERKALAQVQVAGRILAEHGPQLRRVDPNLAKALELLGKALTYVKPVESELQEEQPLPPMVKHSD